MGALGIFRVVVGSDFEHWSRFDLFLTVVGYDARGQRICYCSCRERRADGTIAVESQPCCYIEIYAYVIANAFPPSELIRDAPPFTTELSVWRDGMLLSTAQYETNQWGGLTVNQLRVPND
ncbi:MAG: hypothetical protein LBH06_01930 [Rikenellaceae bacterium]|jgi:hypothetical protein|nr:hypothetical protein [Rikenellaceae bacterium]